MEKFFNIEYEFDFDRERVHGAIEEQVEADRPDYICVSNGVILNTAKRNEEYRSVINGEM